MPGIYDNEAFFAAYGEMPRSREGLSAAGEWSRFRLLFPRLEGKRVLDLGCGYGWHCEYAARMGAAFVLGLDISEKMIEKARRNTVPRPSAMRSGTWRLTAVRRRPMIWCCPTWPCTMWRT